MNKNQFIVLCAGVLGMLFFLLIGQETVKTAISEGDEVQKLFPNIDTKLGSVDRIVISHKDESVNLVNKNSTWVVTEKSDFPAKTQAIRELLDSLIAMDLIEKKTKKADNYPTLAIDDAQAYKVELKKGEEVIASALFGKASSGLQGQFVRIASDPQVWLGNKTLELDVAGKDWIVDEIVNVAPDQVTQVERKTSDGEFTLKEANGKFTLEAIPEDKQLADDYLFSGVKSALSDLKALDVLQADQVDWSSAVESVYRTADKMYLVTHTKYNDKDYVKLQVKPIPLATNENDTNQDQTDSQPTDDAKDTQQASAETLEQLNARWKNWAFEIASYKAEGMHRDLNDLLVAKVEEVTESEEEADSASR